MLDAVVVLVVGLAILTFHGRITRSIRAASHAAEQQLRPPVTGHDDHSSARRLADGVIWFVVVLVGVTCLCLGVVSIAGRL
jgi:hypothetical protein